MSGKVIIKTLNASLTRDTETFGKMDPFVVVYLGGQKFTTSVCNDGGKHPYWKDVFTAQRNNEDVIRFEVLDYDTMSNNDAIGSGVLSVQQVIQSPGQHYMGQVLLTHKGKSSGTLNVDVYIEGGYPQAYGQYPPQGQYPQHGQYPPPAQYPPQGQYPPPAQYPPPQGQYPAQYPPAGQYPPQTYPQYPPAQYPSQQYPSYPAQPVYPKQGVNVQVVYRTNCQLCKGTGFFYKKGKQKPCKACLLVMGKCEKCGGTGYNVKKKKPCKCIKYKVYY